MSEFGGLGRELFGHNEGVFGVLLGSALAEDVAAHQHCCGSNGDGEDVLLLEEVLLLGRGLFGHNGDARGLGHFNFLSFGEMFSL